MRTDNPLFARGLSTAQRLCYFNAMSHFLYALPRLIFLTAPLIYLVFGHVNIPGYWAAILAYAFPHLVLSNIANSRIQGQHRHSFWNEIYETVLAPYILLPTMLRSHQSQAGQLRRHGQGRRREPQVLRHASRAALCLPDRDELRRVALRVSEALPVSGRGSRLSVQHTCRDV